MATPDDEIHFIACSLIINQNLIVNRRCGQREKAVESAEICEGPVGITKTLSYMMIFTVRDTAGCFIHFAYSTLPETDSYSTQNLS